MVSVCLRGVGDTRGQGGGPLRRQRCLQVVCVSESLQIGDQEHVQNRGLVQRGGGGRDVKQKQVNA